MQEIGNFILATGILAGMILFITVNVNYTPKRERIKIKPKKYGESIRKKRMLKKEDRFYS